MVLPMPNEQGRTIIINIRLDGHLRIRIITDGVHQGSILGPILFLLHIIYLQNLVPVKTLETVYSLQRFQSRAAWVFTRATYDICCVEAYVPSSQKPYK